MPFTPQDNPFLAQDDKNELQKLKSCYMFMNTKDHVNLYEFSQPFAFESTENLTLAARGT
jgi:hypothetical protein